MERLGILAIPAGCRKPEPTLFYVFSLPPNQAVEPQRKFKAMNLMLQSSRGWGLVYIESQLKLCDKGCAQGFCVSDTIGLLQIKATFGCVGN